MKNKRQQERYNGKFFTRYENKKARKLKPILQRIIKIIFSWGL